VTGDTTREAAKRTLAVVLKGYPRLSETFIAQELHGLERHGFNLVIVSLRHPTDKARHPVHGEIVAPVLYLPEYLSSETGRVLRGVVRAAAKPGFWRAIRAFIADLRREPTCNRMRRFGQACVLAAEMPADIGHLYAHFIHTPTAVTRYASLMSGIPFSCSAHAKDIWTSPTWDLAQNLAAATWVTTCTAVGERYLKSLSAAPDTVHLVYHGLNLDRFPSPQPTIAARDGSDAGHPVRLLSVGRAVEKKGFDRLLDALAQLPPDLSWRFTHVGGGDHLVALKAQAQRLGIADRITWRGALAQADVLEAYRNADLFILPSRIATDGDRDGLPNVLVEAQSQRLACISTAVSAIPEFIEDGRTGCLVPPDDVEALAGSITVLAGDPERRARLGAAGERRVRDHFDAEHGLAQLVALFPAPVQPRRADTPEPRGATNAAEAAE
jgi:glycosyltransferase involved in cell wall biosynthesis